jgi:phage-related protein
LWELRPINDRVLFLVWYENSFIMLHHFVKKTRKTPVKEIEQARREILDIKKGSGTYE